MPTHLGESCDPAPHVWENRGLVAHLQVKIDGLVREGGELITEAKPIDPLDLSPVREAVILLLGLPVDGVAEGVLHRAVNIIVASSDDLTTTKDTRHLLLPESNQHTRNANQAQCYWTSHTFHFIKPHNLLKQGLRHLDFTEDDTKAEREKVNWPWSPCLRGAGLGLESMSA